MTKIDLGKKMIEIVLDNMTLFQTDLSYDFSDLYTSGNVSYVWGVGENGTYFHAIDITYVGCIAYNAFKSDYCKRFFKMTNKTGTDNGYEFVEIDKETALALRENNL